MTRSIAWRIFNALGFSAALVLSGCGGSGSAQNSSAADTALADPAALAQPRPPQTPLPPLPTSSEGARAQLGRLIFGDPNLSEPRGTPCVACHQPDRGFAGNHGSRIGVALGSLPGALGLRNAQANSYSGFTPAFSITTRNGQTEAHGGIFWDGRVDTLAQQALGPLLNPLEMNNPSRKAVVDKIAAAPYAAQFRQVFGSSIFNDTDAAFTQIGIAIEAFERAALQPFNSKYDAMLRGAVSLSPAETRGMALFRDPQRANCAGCHAMNPASNLPQDNLFTDFKYYATGIPRNTAIPRNADATFFDLGLCGPERAASVGIDSLCGKFRIPSLRNVAQRPAFMHNGFFNNLHDVVRFYSTRNSNPQRWYGAAGVPNDLPSRYLANIESGEAPFNRTPTQGPLLSESEINDIVAFLNTLSDGFAAP